MKVKFYCCACVQLADDDIVLTGSAANVAGLVVLFVSKLVCLL